MRRHRGYVSGRRRGSLSQRNGTNVFATVPASKTDGPESVVIGASWLSRQGGVNVRGVSTVLAMARFLSRPVGTRARVLTRAGSSLWSKDIVLLIADDYADGADAWASAQVGAGSGALLPRSGRLTTAEPLTALDGGVGPPWAALWLDYPYHSFSRMEIFYGAPAALSPG